MRRNLPQFLFAVLVLGVLLVREVRTPPIADVEEGFIDWLRANSTVEHGQAPVMLVEMNDNSLVDYPWPWSPLPYALFLKAGLEFHARVTAIEPALVWDEKTLKPEQLLQQPQFEKFLHDYILRTPKLELGAQLGFPEDPDVLPPLQPLPVFRNVVGSTAAVPEYTVIEAEPGEDLRLMTALGFTNVPPAETEARHAPMVFRYRGQLVPSFTLEALMLYHGVLPEEVQIRLGTWIKLGNKLTIPINSAGGMLVDWKQPFNRAGFDDLELAVDQLEQKRPPIIEPGKLNDRLVVLARTDAKSQTLLLPTGRMGSPGELFAEAMATAETGAFARPAGWAGSVLVVALGLGLAWVVSRKSRRWTALVTLGFMAGYLLACLVVFEGTHIALPLTPMLGLAAFVAVFRMLGGK